MCPSDDVPCNAGYLGDDLSDQGLQQALSRLVRHARQLEAAQGDACDCADRPPVVEEVPEPEPRQVTFFSLPAEIRNEIYRLYFADANVLTEVSAVRMRQSADRDAMANRLARNFPQRRPGRHILDHMWDPPESAPDDWEPDTTVWQREMAAITYEASADDRDLPRLPGERLGLLRANRDTRLEAGGYFFGQNFRFTLPRDDNFIRADEGIFHGINAADAFFTGRSPENLAQFTEIELDLSEARIGFERELHSFTMTGSAPDRRYNRVTGLNRLTSLSNTLRQMPFRHLRLAFADRPPRWYRRRLTVSGRSLFPNHQTPNIYP